MVRKSKELDEQADLAAQFDHNLPDELPAYQATSKASIDSKCGGALRAARESQGLSVHEIASRLRLSPKQIDAIEADNFAALPEPTIVRGFIRNYAKLLKIDAQSLLDAYVVIVPTALPYQMAVKPPNGMRMSHQEKSKSGRYALAALALLLGVAVWLFYQHYVAKPSPTQPSANAGTNANANSVDENVTNQNAAGDSATGAAAGAVLPEAALPAAERAAEPAATGAQTSTVLTLPSAGLPANLPANLPATNQVAPAAAVNPAVVAPPSAALPVAPLPTTPSSTAPTTQSTTQLPSSQLPNSQLTASTTLSAPAEIAALDTAEPLATPLPKGVAKLEFNASQETWVNVEDANGRKIYSKVIFAGSRESIDVKPPVNVTVGNAGGTSMSMNGKSVELAPHSRNNVAHILLNK